MDLPSTIQPRAGSAAPASVAPAVVAGAPPEAPPALTSITRPGIAGLERRPPALPASSPGQLPSVLLSPPGLSTWTDEELIAAYRETARATKRSESTIDTDCRQLRKFGQLMAENNRGSLADALHPDFDPGIVQELFTRTVESRYWNAQRIVTTLNAFRSGGHVGLSGPKQLTHPEDTQAISQFEGARGGLSWRRHQAYVQCVAEIILEMRVTGRGGARELLDPRFDFQAIRLELMRTRPDLASLLMTANAAVTGFRAHASAPDAASTSAP